MTTTKIDQLSKKLDTKLSVSDKLPAKKQTVKPDTKRLIELTKKFRETLEDYTVETTIHIVTTNGSK